MLDAMHDAWVADLRGDGFTEDKDRPPDPARPLPLRDAPLIVVPCLELSAAHGSRDEHLSRAERDMYHGLHGRHGARAPWSGPRGREPRLGLDLVHPVLPGLAARALDLPPGWRPMGTVAIGRPAAPSRAPRPQPRHLRRRR